MSATIAIAQTVRGYYAPPLECLSRKHVISALALALNPFRIVHCLFLVSYILVQSWFIIPLFKQRPPKKEKPLPKPHGRIAIIGAGLTGISSAAHCISHNFEVVIFESKKEVGGIWVDVNSTSRLQLNSLIYRFHPGLIWKHTYPPRQEILSEISRIWKEYKLEPRTRFNTPVRSVRRFEDAESPGAKWIINDGDDGPFDAIIVTIGTCGKPQMVDLPGMPRTHWADEQEAEDREKEATRKKLSGDGGRSYGGDFRMPGGGHNNPKQSDSDRKRAEKERKERERAERERRERENRRRDGRDAPSFAEVAHHPPADDSVAINDAPEGESPVENGRDDDAESESGLWEDTDEDRETAKEGGSPREQHNGGLDSQKERPPLSSQSDETYEGTVLHSSELDNAKLKGKTVVIIGSGASGVEAAETALEGGAKKVVVIARDDKWIIPRNTFIDTLISAQPFGREMPFSFLWEWFIRTFHYRGLKDLAPVKTGIYEGTPVVNNTFLTHIREKRIDYIRGDTERLTSSGALVHIRAHGTKSGDKPLSTREIPGEVIVLATGFKRPDLDFLPQDLFPEGYERPNLYLQNFSTRDWSVLCTNSSYMNAISTVGHFHIGIYTRILLLFLLVPDARPEERDMRLWVDVVRFVKRGAKGGALGFFTYMELVIWFLTFHVFRPDRLRWIFFTMQGWGVPIQN